MQVKTRYNNGPPVLVSTLTGVYGDMWRKHRTNLVVPEGTNMFQLEFIMHTGVYGRVAAIDNVRISAGSCHIS